MARIFSGIQPSGEIHLGNLLGALRHWTAEQHKHDCVYCIVDLHALTHRHDPARLRVATLDLAQVLISAGLDPQVCTLFVQSHLSEHSEMAWLLQCTASFGELGRMTQFKSKSEQSDFISAALFTYPALQAGDILLYDTDIVPVGDDQRQHVELTCNIAERFNHHYGKTFVVPKHQIPPTGARVMDLQNPAAKMSKSDGNSPGTIKVLDDDTVIAKKIKRSVTDSESEVRYDTETKPGVSNLLEILAATVGEQPDELAGKLASYKELKEACATAVIELLKPVKTKYQELKADPSETERLLMQGGEKAKETASATLSRAKRNIGL